MNQKGFATIFALCMILIIALVVKGIQESEMNHAYETADFQAAFELQNAADSGIYAAVAKVQSEKENGNEILRANPYASDFNRKDYRYQFNTLTVKSKYLGKIKVNTWGERLTGDRQAFQSYKKTYPTGKTPDDSDSRKSGYILFSMAEVESKRTGEKIYRRAFAYVLDDDSTIHFMELFLGDDD